jgi:hypothetical protein
MRKDRSLYRPGVIIIRFPIRRQRYDGHLN